jgi:hypothetical protein
MPQSAALIKNRLLLLRECGEHRPRASGHAGLHGGIELLYRVVRLPAFVGSE